MRSTPKALVMPGMRWDLKTSQARWGFSLGIDLCALGAEWGEVAEMGLETKAGRETAWKL